MRVMILVKATVASETGEMPSPQRLTAMAAYHDTLIEAGILLAGEGPKPSRCGKRVRFSGEARTVSDGPFAESPETHAATSEPRLNPRIRRFLTTVHRQARSLEEAVEWVRRCPNPMPADSDIEIRPLYEAADFS